MEILGTSLEGRLYETLSASWLGPLHASLAFALASTTLWPGVMALFYRHRTFIKV